MKIRTEFIHPPIPIRCFDWSAVDEDTYDGAEDSRTRGQIGRGATEAEAIADLMEILEEERVMIDLKYPTAVGHLQATSSHAAIDIESIVRNVVMDAWAKEDLLKVARSLREANEKADDICDPTRASENAGRVTG